MMPGRLKYVINPCGLIACILLCLGSVYAQSSLQSLAITKEEKATYSALLENNKTIVAFIENTLVKNSLPKMLRNLAMIESGFNKNAVSSARACGIWQFTKGHANAYGLSDQDRFDVFKSTNTAVKSLKDLYNKYNNWITVVAAYNCGEGNVDKAMEKAGSTKYHEFYTYLPAETINHVHKFMAACNVTNEEEQLMSDYKLSLFKTKNVEQDTLAKSKGDPSLISTEITMAFDPAVIAEEVNINILDLNKWNPNLLKELIVNGVATLYLPVDVMPDFLLQKNTILNKSLYKEKKHE